MKKRFAIVLTLILATANFTACTVEENLNNDIKTSVVLTTADVSASERILESTTDKQTTENTTVSEVVEPTEKNTKSKVKPDTGQNMKSESQNTTAQATEKVETTVAPSTAKAKQSTTVKSTEKNTQKPTPKPSEKATQKPTQKVTVKPTEKASKKEINLQKVVSACISYGKKLGIIYDSELNTENASWFSPTNSAYYDDTQSLITACYEDIKYVAYYYEDDGIKPSDMSFNVIELNKKIYVVYC